MKDQQLLEEILETPTQPLFNSLLKNTALVKKITSKQINKTLASSSKPAVDIYATFVSNLLQKAIKEMKNTGNDMQSLHAILHFVIQLLSQHSTRKHTHGVVIDHYLIPYADASGITDEKFIQLIVQLRLLVHPETGLY